MASTTNYNWTTPDNSGLVKNGAQDIRTLGSAVDTSVWNIGYGQAAKNKLINGNCAIWQRGTSFSIGAFDPKYTTDRWYYFTATGSNTITQETSTVPTGNRYATKWTSGGAGGTFAMYQIIETNNAQFLAGKTVTVQVQATGTTGKNVQITLDYSTSVDATAGASFTAIGGSSTSATVTSGTFSTLTYTGTIPSTAKTVRVGVQSAGTFANTENVIWANAQLEIGSYATPFQTASGSFGGELQLAQRYSTTWQGDAYEVIGQGAATSTTSAQIVVSCPVNLRSTISSVDYSTLQLSDGVNADIAVTSVAIANQGQKAFAITVNVASGLTQYRTYRLRAANSTSGLLRANSEL